MIQYLKLGSLTRIRTGKLDANAADDNGKYPFFTCSKEPLSINTCSYDCECVLVAGNGDLNVKYYDGKFDAYQRTYIIESLDKTKLMVKYLYCFLDLYVEILRQQAIGGVIKYIKLGNLADAIIPVPVIEKQREIIEIIEKCNGTIAYRHQELLLMDQLVKSRFIELFGDPMINSKGYPLVTYGNLFELNAGGTPSKKESKYWDGGNISWIGSNMCQNEIIYQNDGKFITEEGYNHSSAKIFPIDTVLIALVGATIGKTALLKFQTTTNQNILGIRHIKESSNNPYFVFYYTQGLYNKFLEIGDGGFNMASKEFVSKLPFPIVPIDLQNEFAKFVEETDKSKYHGEFTCGMEVAA